MEKTGREKSGPVCHRCESREEPPVSISRLGRRPWSGLRESSLPQVFTEGKASPTTGVQCQPGGRDCSPGQVLPPSQSDSFQRPLGSQRELTFPAALLAVVGGYRESPTSSVRSTLLRFQKARFEFIHFFNGIREWSCSRGQQKQKSCHPAVKESNCVCVIGLRAFTIMVEVWEQPKCPGVKD